jgi:hypothetical protein
MLKSVLHIYAVRHSYFNYEQYRISPKAKENNLISMDYIFDESIEYPVESNVSLKDRIDIINQTY